MLPQGDRTPDSWVLPRESAFEVRLKKPLRRTLYPTYLRLVNALVRRRCKLWQSLLGVDQWYWGHRGLEYELLRARLQRLCGIRGKSVLIAGCGTGRDVPTWLRYEPARVLGVDYFDYHRAWAALVREYGHRAQLSFMQGDLRDMGWLADEVFDVVGSDAVFEHLRDLPSVLREFHRILKPGGVVYATFGPLWYSWGGDHLSGYDGVASGYSHLVLERGAYERYLDGAGEFSHSEDDGRTWIKHGLFSYLRPREYLTALSDAGFEKVHLGVVLEPRAVRSLRENPKLKARLVAENDELDLIATAMTIIYRKAW